MEHLTKLKGVPDSGDVVPGMAYFAGTGPAGKTCGDCLHKGYYRQGETWDEKQGRWVAKTRRYGGCAKFKQLTGKQGPAIKAENRACKYFEVKL